MEGNIPVRAPTSKGPTRDIVWVRFGAFALQTHVGATSESKTACGVGFEEKHIIARHNDRFQIDPRELCHACLQWIEQDQKQQIEQG